MNKKQIRRGCRISVPMNTKSNTHTESVYVDLSGISGKVITLTRGGLQSTCSLQASQDEVTLEQSAEPIVNRRRRLKG